MPMDRAPAASMREAAMLEAREPADAQERQAALDPGRSFIVQAPAGSGKTELLVQRYLRLLGTVDEPEEIVALTFTRKAAGEMRRRVLDALERARGEAPEAEHERFTWELARAARERDAARGWNVAASPLRLTITTIDSLCASLVRRMPWLSRLGGAPEVTEDAQPLYREAAERSLDDLEGDEAWAEPIASLLERLDNDRAKAVRQLQRLLARRDQWLRHLGSDRVDREAVEAGVRAAVSERLEAVRERLRGERATELIELVRYAARNLRDAGAEEHELVRGAPWEQLPGTDPQPEALARWRALASLLVTKTEPIGVRKNLNTNQGFPKASGKGLSKEESRRRKEMKQRAADLLGELRADEPLVARLVQLAQLPDPVFQDGDWEALEALARALLVAAGNLELIFGERRQADFVQVASGAIAALGDPEAPTDLTFSLDAQIRHVLVDEFQDTSVRQVALLERLTAGWEPGDGRTLFVVGDPMQSIYAFREAEVGLFLRARQQGIGTVPLEPLRLGTNFRSRPRIVEWINDAFGNAFPGEEWIDEGAVRFARSVPFRPPGEADAVEVHALVDASPEQQARLVAELIARERGRDAQQRIAVLVRSRSHAKQLVPALRDRQLRFRAVEIEGLAERPAVQDLLALTRAIAHPGDRVAWLAVLRAPWCGLELADLHALIDGDRQACVWDLLVDALRQRRLRGEAADRAERLRRQLEPVLDRAGREPLAGLVRRAWLRLGGPSAAQAARDLADAETFFERLARFEGGGNAPLDVLALEEQLGDLYAAPDTEAPEELQILTLHRAKGLEFDTVILPFLERQPRSSDRALLEWVERPGAEGGTDLMVAPVKAAWESEKGQVRRFVEGILKRREANERVRLAYVAATRARARLHLVGNGNLQDGAVKKPSPSSLLNVVWPAVEGDFASAAERWREQSAPSIVAGRADSGVAAAGQLRRLGRDAALPEPPADLQVDVREPALSAGDLDQTVAAWASPRRRHVGTVVHRALEQIAREGIDAWSESRVRQLAGAHRAALAGLGVPPDELDAAVGEVREAVSRVLSSPRGRWLLDPRHDGATSEIAVGVLEDGAVRYSVIDRSFVDEDGVRWVIDYKTGHHEGGDLDRFLEGEVERYREQLARYAAAMRAREPGREVRAALYFPLHDAWRPVDV